MSDFDGEVTVHYDEAPGSVNAGKGGYGKHWGQAHSQKLAWEGIYQMLFMQAKLPRRLAYVEVNAELQFTTPNTRRDPDNFHHPVAKPLGDALVKGGWLEDDNPEFYELRKVALSREKLTGVGPLVKSRIVLNVKYRLGSDAAGTLSPGGADPGRAASAGEPLGESARG